MFQQQPRRIIIVGGWENGRMKKAKRSINVPAVDLSPSETLPTVTMGETVQRISATEQEKWEGVEERNEKEAYKTTQLGEEVEIVLRKSQSRPIARRSAFARIVSKSQGRLEPIEKSQGDRRKRKMYELGRPSDPILAEQAAEAVVLPSSVARTCSCDHLGRPCSAPVRVTDQDRDCAPWLLASNTPLSTTIWFDLDLQYPERELLESGSVG
ncbi:hypothetical protein BU16DRAFT_540166 [Lophium mytilinum]|uniref:Uncharacterized protein n=1 Tax=Lophium mytilinum TaxID=390894 RepID=A0A6A6QVI6_9PEZI|nr:hypothetical protein BU16DRAFT_540166 [Lophium mytilinum]